MKDIATFKKLVADMHAAGFTYGSELMRDVYACALLAYVGGMKAADTLMSRKHQSQPHPSTTSRSARAAQMHWVYAQIVRAEKQFGADNRVVQFERLTFATRLR
jgi:hypothetical protein